MMTLGAAAAAEARLILDRAARRLLAARLDHDSVGAPARTHDGALNYRADEGAPLVEREYVPVAGANGYRRRGSSE